MSAAFAPSFSDLIRPLDEDSFFARYWQQELLHVSGEPRRFEELMSWETLTRLLNMTSYWTPSSLQVVLDGRLVPPAHYCEARLGGAADAVMRPHPQRLMALAREGASLLANGIQSLTPELAHVAAVLQARFNARTEANLYCSRAHKRAFRSHFDSHHVFALHIAGEKTWNVYEARAEEPINHARFKLPMDETVRRRGAVREQFRMRPGDLLYIPRGIYHDALANSESSIHISFSVMGVIGWDLLQLLTDQALDDAFVRRTLPRYEEGEAALLAHLEALRGRLDGILGSERFVQALRRYQQGISEGPGEVHLPIRGDSSKD